MKITVIPSDSTIILNGRVLVFPFVSPVDMHALQWYGEHGTIETVKGNQSRLTDYAVVHPYVDAFNVESTRLAAIAAIPAHPNVAILNAITREESKATNRLFREAIASPALVDPVTGRTPAQQITFINDAIVALRGTLT